MDPRKIVDMTDEKIFFADSLLCPIAHKPFRNAVITKKGYSFEEQEIIKWIESKGTDPIGGGSLTKDDLRPNYVIMSAVREYSDNILPQLEELKITKDLLTQIVEQTEREREEVKQRQATLENKLKETQQKLEAVQLELASLKHPNENLSSPERITTTGIGSPKSFSLFLNRDVTQGTNKPKREEPGTVATFTPGRTQKI